MLFEQLDMSRYLLVFIIQPIISFILLYLVFKILKRNRTLHTIILSFFYFIVSIGFLLNIIYALAAIFNNELMTYLIFYITSYLIIDSPVYLIVFIKMLLKIEEKPNLRKELIYAVIYGILCTYIFFFPNGLTISEKTGWKPLYSFEFLIFSYFFMTFLIILPLIYYSLKLYRTIETNILKKKFKLFIGGTLGFVSVIYGTILYNTWHYPLYRLFWSISVSFFLIAISLLIYFGIGKDL
ncbi:MAG: hypothetical protein ACTSUG_06185 [Candidatus Helarchaeota archaeon]